MKAIDQYFPVVLFIVLHKVALAFEFVDEILKCDHSNACYYFIFVRLIFHFSAKWNAGIFCLELGFFLVLKKHEHETCLVSFCSW